jgi:malonyl-CoA decarboxylase
MALNDRLNQVLRGVRRWRGSSRLAPIPLHPDLPDGDWRHLTAEIDATVEAKGGPVAARRRAQVIGLTYETLSASGRLQFFTHLARDYDHDDGLVDQAMDAVFRAKDPDARRSAERDLRAKLQPRREVLFRRLAGIDGGLPFLISMRSDLLAHRKDSAELGALDAELRQILAEWFDVGLLRLERLTWDTPASFLEKLIEYEAVHAIESWDDLKHRLGPGRRCYAFVHPGMPNDPLIFVEVALTKDIARALGPLLEMPDATNPNTSSSGSGADIDIDKEEDDFDTAIFYSISNCHRGLAGVSLGDFLIKSVVEELSAELVNLKTFATLSPIPGFRGWLQTMLDSDEPPAELAGLVPVGAAPGTSEGTASPAVAERLGRLVSGPLRSDTDAELTLLKPVLLQLVARYLLEGRRGQRAADPVAHFHLSNGARVEYVNWLANPNQVGWDRGLAMMVNYRYELKAIERNHDRYVNEGEVTASDAVRKLLDGPKGS